MNKWFKSKGHKIAVAVGLFFASLHALWALVVALGVGQKYLNWIFPMHFIDNLYTVMNFNLVTAVLLVLVAFVSGYIVTWLFLWFWKLMKIK
jgi:hypothetical protein